MSLPQRFFASASRPSYRSHTATSFIPGTVSAVVASATPMPPEPINAICNWSLAANFCWSRSISSKFRFRSLAVTIAGSMVAPTIPFVNFVRKDRLEFSSLFGIIVCKFYLRMMVPALASLLCALIFLFGFCNTHIC